MGHFETIFDRTGVAGIMHDDMQENRGWIPAYAAQGVEEAELMAAMLPRSRAIDPSVPVGRSIG